MTFDLQKLLNGLLLLLTVCLGLLVGRFAADWLGMALAPEQSLSEVVSTERVLIKKQRLQEFSTISQRNLFDSNAVPTTLDEPISASSGKTESRKTSTRSADLKLLGTVAGGENQLAVIRSGKDAEVYQVGDTLPGDLTLSRVERDKAFVESSSGQETMLELVVEKSNGRKSSRAKAQKRTSATKANVIELGKNRWQIPKEEAEKARSNLNTLLKTARMVPKIENGSTVGFTIVNIQPGTFLDLLGLKVGDVLVQVNQVELNSPEKALQIFQQVREANNLSLGLLRNGSRQTFEYIID